VLVKSDANAAITRYAELKRDHPTEYPFSGYLILRTGNWLLDKGRTMDAIKLLEFCVSEFPNSTSGFDKLGETYMKIGNKELAIKNYEKSLQLNSDNKNAQEMLKQLRNTK
jgi:predicted Zn-dependent protease